MQALELLVRVQFRLKSAAFVAYADSTDDDLISHSQTLASLLSVIAIANLEPPPSILSIAFEIVDTIASLGVMLLWPLFLPPIPCFDSSSATTKHTHTHTSQTMRWRGITSFPPNRAHTPLIFLCNCKDFDNERRRTVDAGLPHAVRLLPLHGNASIRQVSHPPNSTPVPIPWVLHGSVSLTLWWLHSLTDLPNKNDKLAQQNIMLFSLYALVFSPVCHCSTHETQLTSALGRYMGRCDFERARSSCNRALELYSLLCQ